jgi:hypothetical protein
MHLLLGKSGVRRQSIVFLGSIELFGGTQRTPDTLMLTTTRSFKKPYHSFNLDFINLSIKKM